MHDFPGHTKRRKDTFSNRFSLKGYFYVGKVWEPDEGAKLEPKEPEKKWKLGAQKMKCLYQKEPGSSRYYSKIKCWELSFLEPRARSWLPNLKKELEPKSRTRERRQSWKSKKKRARAKESRLGVSSWKLRARIERELFPSGEPKWLPKSWESCWRAEMNRYWAGNSQSRAEPLVQDSCGVAWGLINDSVLDLELGCVSSVSNVDFPIQSKVAEFWW